MIENDVATEKLLIKKRSVKDLADYIRIMSGTSPNYSLFLGAGASVTSGIKTGYELVQEWREEIYKRLNPDEYSSPKEAITWLTKNHPDWYDPSNEYSSLFEKKFDLPSQRRRFVELQVDKKLPSIGYAYLVELFESKYLDTVFTTNFDDLINEAFYQFSSDRPLLCAHDSSIKGISITSSRPKIIKLHGDYLFDSIKSSLRETESLENNTREKLDEFAKEYGLIFVGYAGNDNSIMEVLKYLLKQDDYLRNGIYWCRRKNDQISPELFKLLNHDKVYWVEIDGFDELMAELVHELGCELSLSGAQKSTKRERMIQNFINDDFSLNKNNYINNDLIKLKKHTLTQDISSLINELSENDNDNQKIPEQAFKNLLFIDNLIKEKKYNIAEDNLNALIRENISSNMKSKYLQRLINIKEDQNDTKSALEYSDRLIELDEFNLNYALSRTNIFPEFIDKINYLKSLSDKFKYSVDLKYHLCNISLRYLEEHDEHEGIITFSEIKSLLDESIRLSSSLDNRAWRLKYDTIKIQNIQNHVKKEQHEQTLQLLNEIKEINPIHDTYLYLYSSYVNDKKDKTETLKCIEILGEAFKASSKSKKKKILRYLSSIHLGLFEIESEEDNKELMENFIAKYSEDKDTSNIAPFIIFKARYEIGCNKDIDKGISLAKEAMDSIWRHNHIQSIVDILLIDKNNIPLIDEFLESLPRDTSEILLLKIKGEVARHKKDYMLALKLFDDAHKKKWDFGAYITAKVYTLLLARNYNEAIRIADHSITKIKDVRDRDVLIINRETAKKRIEQEVKKHELHSILAHHQSKGQVAMCAFFLLGDELKANRQLQSCIERDYMNYFYFLEWPALPENVLSRFNIASQKVA